MKVFISHSSTDKRFVRKLKDDLNENDIQTWFDEDELDLGDTLSDKLDSALEDSSHFLIVLSEASVKSEWVQYELEKALKQKNSNLLQKVIPVKYKSCEVPKELEKLLYSDISKEIREVIGDRIVFTTPGYKAFLEKLCNSIRNSEKQLTQQDKVELKREIKTDPLKEQGSLSHNIVRSSYVVVGYRSRETRERYAQDIKAKGKLTIDISEVRPILLPPLLNFVFKDLKVGDKILFSKNYFGNEYGHFGGFRKDDLGITHDYRVRKGIFAKKGNRYNVEIDTKERRIVFMTK
jgi:hypothetical protein